MELEELLLEWSYRCKDGIVDLNDPTKLKILEKILSENNIDESILEEAEDGDYDKVIKNALKVSEIPLAENHYTLGKDTNVTGIDQKYFKLLYPVAPPKKGKDVDSAGSKGSGNGEVAVYWLFKYQPDGYSVMDTRGSSNPDLNIDGIGVEVKAYDSSRMTLGRVGSDTENINLLNTVFGLHSLVNVLGNDETPSKASSLNFSKKDIVSAFESFHDFSKNQELRELSTKYSVIKNIFDKIDELESQLEITPDTPPEDAAASIVKRVLTKKLSVKPGFGGYILNVNEGGNLKFTQITEEKVNNISSKDLLDNLTIIQGAMNIAPNNLF